MIDSPVHDSSLLRHKLLEQLKSFLAARDFFFLPEWNQFRRLTPAGFQSVIISWSPYEDLSVLEVHLGIRHDAVENIAFPFTNGLPGFQQNSMTVVTPLSKLFGEPYQRFGVQTEEDVLKASQEILNRLSTRGVSFLEKYSRLEAVDTLFNAQPSEPIPLIHNQVHRCLRAIAIARLSLRRDFESLGGFYRRQLKNLCAPEPIIDRYERLLLYLRSYSHN